MDEEMELLEPEDVLNRLDDMEPGTEEHKALLWLRDLHYLQAEGFIAIEDDRLFHA